MGVFAFNPRDMKRLMRQFGIRMEEVRAERVVIELDDGRRLIIDQPVSVLRMEQRGQPPTFFVIGEARIEEPVEEATGEAPEISEEDVMLVAEQAGVSPEEARKALEEAGGDIAEAILRLQEGKQQ